MATTPSETLTASGAPAIAGAALHRQSIRKYDGTPISHEQITELLRLAGRAPSAWNLQPWRFVVATSTEAKLELQAAAYNQPQVGSAAAVIVVTSDMENSLERLDEAPNPVMPTASQESMKASVRAAFGKMNLEQRGQWGRNQTYIALGYLLLILEANGVASSPMLGFDPAAVRKLYDLPDYTEIAALVAIGHAAEEGVASQRLDTQSIVRFV